MHFIYHFVRAEGRSNEKEVYTTRVGLGVRWENLGKIMLQITKKQRLGIPNPQFIHSNV